MKLLVDLLPAKYRKYLYAAGAVAALVYTAYLAADGDWRKALGSLFATFLAALASANTNSTSTKDAGDKATETYPQESLDELWVQKLKDTGA